LENCERTHRARGSFLIKAADSSRRKSSAFVGIAESMCRKNRQ
jgi:hypothetical protein